MQSQRIESVINFTRIPSYTDFVIQRSRHGGWASPLVFFFFFLNSQKKVCITSSFIERKKTTYAVRYNLTHPGDPLRSVLSALVFVNIWTFSTSCRVLMGHIIWNLIYSINGGKGMQISRSFRAGERYKNMKNHLYLHI